MDKLKQMCINLIKEELKEDARITKNIISFRLKKVHSKEIEILNDLTSMCKNVSLRPFKGEISVILTFGIY